MKKLILHFFLFLSACLFAQVGINTTNPDAQLDIRSSNQANPSNTDGILIPKIDFFPAVNPGFNQNGMMVFLTNTVGTNTPGFYYWEAATNNWIKILSGNSGAGNLDDAYNFGGPGQGKEIIANFGPLTISGNDGILSSGNLGSGSIGFVGTGEKMFWSPSRAAFRAGSINSFQWEIFNVGTYSFSFGRNNLALGDFSAVWGDSNEANQIHSTLWGEGNISNGSNGTVFGRFNNQSGINSTVWGLTNVVTATNSTVYGQNNVVDGDKNSVWGERNNLTNVKNTVWGEENNIAGDKSTVWGDFNQITSNQTTVWGENNQAQSLLSTIWGRNNISNCIGCTIWGSFNIANSFSTFNFEDNTIFGRQNNVEFGRYSTAWGLNNYAQSKASTVFGISNFARSIGETVLGIGATDYSPNGGAFSEEFGASFGTDRLLVVGNALDLNNNNLVEDNERKDALVILKNGNTGIGESSPQETLHVNGKIRMADGFQGEGKMLVGDVNGTLSWQDNSAWNITGNSGLNNSTHYLGTNDNTDIIFKRNFMVSGLIGQTNTLFGVNSFSLSPTGQSNSVYGASSFDINANVNENTAVGFGTMSGHSSGNRNTALGANSFQSSSGSQESTAIGYNANVNSNLNSTALGANSYAQNPNSVILGSVAGVNGALNSVNVGVGTVTPEERFHVIGNIRMVDGNQAAGRVLTSDANGTATWQSPTANVWGLTGNIGTNSTTNFLGTADNQSLSLRTNNIERVQISNTGKTFIGSSIPTTDNWADFSKLLVGTNDDDNDLTLRSSGTDIPAFNILRSNGTMSSPTAFNSGELGSIRFWRYTGLGGFDGYVPAGRIVSGISSTGASSLILSGAQASHVIITNTGNVGVGTTPLEKLHVAGRTLLTNGFSADNAALLYQNDTDYMYIGPRSGSSANGGAMALFGSTNTVGGNAGGADFNLPNGQLRINHTGGNYEFRANSTSGYTASFEINDQGLQIGHNSASRAIIFNTNSTERMRLTQIGRLGIGTTTPGGQFELSLNEGRKPGTSTWTIVSDQRLKTINGNYTKGLNEILQLNPIRFNYKNSGERNFEKEVLDTEFAGFVAQEVQPHFPEAIGTDEDGFLNFDIHPILIASINAIKEQQTIIEQQKEEIDLLKQQLQEQYKSIVERLEKIENK